MLAASAYPLEIVQAQRWLDKNHALTWTTDFGDAIVNQPRDVADVIQELRAEAEKSGALAPRHLPTNATCREIGAGNSPVPREGN